MKIRSDYTCPLEIVHDMIRGKWKTILIFQLRSGSASLARLQKDVRGITQKMLLQHLQELQQWGLVTKTSFDGYPLRVEYFLTTRGLRMLEAVEIMQDIGVAYLAEHGQTESLDRRGIAHATTMP